ncbi:hypothetical protein V498_10647 [Pseudogymnoascus sp. VKM F-4517 (FW-2822)]|nr:hypothetical protein V498_10647 [Pseudogymnoascus sp. VKM F-4517 (FW-2822)]
MDAPTATRPLVDDQRSALASVGAAQARTGGGASEAAECGAGVVGALFRRGAESDDPGAIVEAARDGSPVVV